MKRYGYEGSDQFRPITAWGYVGYSILFAIPLIGLIFWLVFIFSDKNINRRSFARSYLCGWLLASIVAAILFGLMAFGIIRLGGFDFVPQIRQKIEETIEGKKVGSSRTSMTEENEETVDEPKTQVTVVPTDEAENSVIEAVEESVVTPEFKETMDTYEAFFAEYVDFMRSFDESSNDLRTLGKFADFMSQYGDTMEKMDTIDEKELSDADMAYYTKVTAHIFEMLAEIGD